MNAAFRRGFARNATTHLMSDGWGSKSHDCPRWLAGSAVYMRATSLESVQAYSSNGDIGMSSREAVEEDGSRTSRTVGQRQFIAPCQRG